MVAPQAQDVTQLLLAWSDGDEAAFGKLIPLVHVELSRLAHRYMTGERSGHMLQTTALVNEAYMRLVDSSRMRWQNRVHFYAVSAQFIETAQASNVSPDSVMRDWRLAKVWLKRGLKSERHGEG